MLREYQSEIIDDDRLTEAELPAAVADTIASWRRVIRNARPEITSDILLNAAADLFRTRKIARTVLPDDNGIVTQAIAEALHDMAQDAGIDDDDAQAIFAAAQDDPPKQMNGLDEKPPAASPDDYGTDPAPAEPIAPAVFTDRSGNGGFTAKALEFVEAPVVSSSWKYHTGEAPVRPRWLIKGILPETGATIMSGQWGTFKTTAALAIAVCVMAGLAFAGRYQVKRRGAVLYFALEGESMLPARLSAIAAHLGVTDPLPFAWRGDCPPLADQNAANKLCRLAIEAAAELNRKFDLPVALIVIDTMITAAGFAAGEDNDAAAAQKVMTALRLTSQRTDALVLGIDHFGKVIETGTRGSSAKEGAADVVIALLADRELSGGVKNTRLALRKLRDGVSGFEIPFTVQFVETGKDDDGDPITAPVIDWQAPQQAPQAEARWTPSMQLLRCVLMTTLVDSGQEVRPFLDGLSVRACDIELVRTEFYRQYPADGTERQKTDARRKAFSRSVKESMARSLVTTREVDGVQLIWLNDLGPANG